MDALVVAPAAELAARIWAVHEAATAAVRSSVEYAATVGRLLLEAKALVPHGDWAAWVEENCPFAERTASAYMKVARKLLNCNDAERQRVADLSLRGTLALLASPRAAAHGTGTGGDEWFTPADVVEPARRVLGGIDLDPVSNDDAQRTVRASVYFTKDTDGLAQPWHGRTWLNPPYSRDLIARFVGRLLAEHAAGNVPAAILLVHAWVGTGWFNDASEVAPAVCFLRKRIRFVRPDGTGDNPPIGSAAFYFGGQPGLFAAEYGRLGFVYPRPVAGMPLLELDEAA